MKIFISEKFKVGEIDFEESNGPIQAKITDFTQNGYGSEIVVIKKYIFNKTNDNNIVL